MRQILARSFRLCLNLRMNSGESLYIWQRPDWPHWRYDLAALASPLADVSRAQGVLLGRLADTGLALREQASLATLTDDVVNTSQIEGETLSVQSVCSSLARRLGVDIGAIAPVDRHVEGIVEMVLDASGPMQFVSGAINRRRVHFEAPPAARLPEEMDRFLAWANSQTPEPALVKAGLAHLWFVTLHPFDDGNGRIARAVGDLFLTRSDGSSQRFYSLSAQIQRDHKAYYDILEHIQKGPLDVTAWLHWFLQTLGHAIDSAQATLDTVLFRVRFWQHWAGTVFNERQVKLLNRLLDGFDGKLTSSRWASMAHCSPDTALRDINQLVALGILQKMPGGGRSTGYELAPPRPPCQPNA